MQAPLRALGGDYLPPRRGMRIAPLSNPEESNDAKMARWSNRNFPRPIVWRVDPVRRRRTDNQNQPRGSTKQSFSYAVSGVSARRDRGERQT